jgi:elongation factor Ts
MSVDAARVKELRERTGLPMMDCKRALVEANGDVGLATENLRKAGAKTQEKLAGREAKEGRISTFVSSSGKVGALVALRCETEPVANNSQFVSFCDALVRVVADKNPADEKALLDTRLPSGEMVAQGLTGLVNQLRENITLGRFARFEADAIAQYVHFDNKKAAMLALTGVSSSDSRLPVAGKELCMQVVFSKPRALRREELDQAFLAKEREIALAAARNDPRNASKPQQVIDKIVDGQMNKLAKDSCLLEQPFVKNDKLTVSDHLRAALPGAEIARFVYIATEM